MDLDFNEYKLIVESSPNMIWRAGTDAKCNYFNQTWLKFTGRSMEQELGDGWAKGVHADDLKRCIQIYLDSFAKREPFEMEYRLRRHDGEYRWINDRGTPFYDLNEQFAGYIGSCMDVTDKVEGQLFKEQAQKDGLCQIYNRYYLQKLLEQKLDSARRKNTSISLLMLDIDDFKYVNDHYGHLVGDIVLQQIASILKSSIRDIDICGRYGGEEFVVVLVRATHKAACEIAERIRAKIAKNVFYIDVVDKTPVSVTISCGISMFQGDDTVETLIGRADKGLYLAKRSGKNCIKTVESW